MKVVVIGLGSMGKRRIRLIRELYPDFIICGIDGREDRRAEAAEKYSISCFESITNIDEDIDCAFVCTSPLSHAGIIKECLERKWDVFTELNLVDDGYDDNIKLAADNNCKLFLSSTFFYREEIRYIRSKVDPGKKWNYIYHIGQYLPDWHPWENYKDYFVGNQRTNGCREIMAIELPWICETFGSIEKFNVLSDKITDLNIAYNDNYMIQLEHEGGNKGCLIVDVVSPQAVRNLEVYSENSYISWGGNPNSLAVFNETTKQLEKISFEEADHIEGYSSFIIENAYKNEIQEFFDVVINGKAPEYGFEKDKKILSIIDALGA